jgi:hypothetical protein
VWSLRTVNKITTSRLAIDPAGQLKNNLNFNSILREAPSKPARYAQLARNTTVSDVSMCPHGDATPEVVVAAVKPA